MFLGARIGLEPAEDNSAAYLQHWTRQLREDPSILQTAVTQAQAAADWILDAARPDAMPVAPTTDQLGMAA